MLRRNLYQIQQRLIAGNATGLNKAGNRCAQANSRGKQLCVSPALLCIAHAGDIQTTCQRKNQTGRMAGDDILTTLTISTQNRHKITLVLRACLHLCRHPVGNGVGNRLDFLSIADNDIIHTLRIACRRRITRNIQQSGDFLIRRRLRLEVAHTAAHTQKFVGRRAVEHGHRNRTLLFQRRIFIVQRSHRADSNALTTAHAATVKIAFRTVLAHRQDARGTALHADTAAQAFILIYC